MFKAGDIVIGNKKANRYLITKSNTIWRVYNNHKNGLIRIVFDKNIQQLPNILINNVYDGEMFDVNIDCFDLYNRTRKSHLPKWF